MTSPFDALTGGLPEQVMDPEDILRLLGHLDLYYRFKNQVETKDKVWEATDIYDVNTLERMEASAKSLAAMLRKRIHSKQDLIRKAREDNKLRARQKVVNKKLRSDS